MIHEALKWLIITHFAFGIRIQKKKLASIGIHLPTNTLLTGS